MWIELFIAFISVLLLWDYLHRRRHKRILKEYGFKGPQLLPLIGGAHHFLRQNPETIFNLLSGYVKEYGKTYQFSILNEYYLMTSDAKFMEALLSSQQVLQKGELYDLLQYWLGMGLLLSTGKKWHTRRKIITPTFHFKILEQFVEVFDKQSSVLVKKLYERADGKSAVNIFPLECLTALDIIAETAMGVKVNAQIDPEFSYTKSITTVASITAKRVISPSQRSDFSMSLFAPREYRQLCKHIKATHDFADKVIAERKTALEKSIADGTYNALDTTDIGVKKRMTFLDVLLQANVAGNPLTNEDIREEVHTFMFEGHDTTTSGISHTLYLIARHPEVQQKLFEEIRDVIGDDKDTPVTMRELQDLKYLDCVIKEGLRLYPPVPLISRKVTQDTVLDGKLVPANTNIVVLIYHTLRDPDYFPDPDQFKPERFSTESTDRIDPFAYVPFSAGPRNCIGQKFAILEMKSTISKVLRHFELLPFGEEVRPVMNIILRSANGIHLGLKPRT